MIKSFLLAICITPWAQYSINQDRDFLELLTAVIWIESANRPAAKSHAGALGLTQMTPIALAELRRAPDTPKGCRPSKRLKFKHMRIPRLNVRYGSCYLQLMLDRHDDRIVPALISYNAGESRLANWYANRRLPHETAVYIAKIYDYLEKYRCPHY